MENNFDTQFIIYKVLKNEKLTDISKKFNVPVQILINENIKRETFEGDRIIIPRAKKISHVVKPAETLQQIANMYDVSIEQIKQNNSITELFIGQILYI